MPLPHHKPAANQYTLDFESARNERYALLMSCVDVVGLGRQKDLARFLFNVLERQPGQPAGFSMAEYAAAIGESKNTARRWLVKLAAAGLVTIEGRARHRGGCRTHLVAIDWEAVRRLAVERRSSGECGRGNGESKSPNSQFPTPHSQFPIHQPMPPNSYRAPIFAHRAPNLGGRTPKLGAPIRKPISYSPEVNTTTTYALPHARPFAATAACPPTSGNEEEEGFVRKLAAECRQRIRNCPRLLETAIRRALANGCSQEQVWNRCKWFAREQTQWQLEHRAGVLHDGLAQALPDVPAHQGWPYQKG